MTGPELSSRVLEFLAQKIDTVPQFEALLLLWQTPDKRWQAAELAARLYVPPDQASAILRSLCLRQLALMDGPTGSYRYSGDWDTSGSLMAEIEESYRRHLVPMTQIIHSGPSAAVRDFARAFSFKRER